jgi:hypothetical protein
MLAGVMAKQGQHRHDVNDQRVSPGRNNPKKSVPITAGSPKKRETYDEQARAHEDPGKQAQHSEPHWADDTRHPTSAIRASVLKPRSGSDSYA